jgi:hypothetical protein
MERWSIIKRKKMLKWYPLKLKDAGTRFRLDHNGIRIFYDEGAEDGVEYRLFIRKGPEPWNRLWIASLPKMRNKIVGIPSEIGITK